MARIARTLRSARALAAAAATLLALAPLSALAQMLDPPAQAPAPRPLQPPRPTLEDPDAAFALEDQNAFSDGRWGAEVRVATPFDYSPEQPGDAERPFVAGQSTSESWDATTETEDPADVLGAEQAALRRAPPPQDGDIEKFSEPLDVPDGVIDLGETYAAVSGDGGTLADIRTPADITAFSGVDAGFDPLLLEAQETNPVFGNDWPGFGPGPFAPLGTRIGSFVLFSEVEADGDYNSNIFASPEALGDYALEVRPAVRLVSDWSTHAVEVRASGDLSFHDKYPSEDDRAYLVEGLGRLDITRFTNVQALLAHEEAQESRSAINATSAGTRPNINVDRARASLNHRFNRLTVQLRGAVIDTSYGTNILNGVVQSNADRNFTLYDEAIRPKWEFSPTFYVFSDVALNQRNYALAAFTDGINRSSTGERYRLGVSFGDTSEILRGEVSLGYGRQTPDADQLEVIDGLLIDGNLIWRIDGLNTLLLTAATDVAETTTVNSGGVLERNYAAEWRHSFTVRLVGIAGVSYYTRNFVGGDVLENQFTAATGIEYFFNRHAVLFGRYQHIAFDTTSFNGNWTGEEVQIGVRLRN